MVFVASAVDERSTVMKKWFVVLTVRPCSSEESVCAPVPSPVEIVPSRVSVPSSSTLLAE